MWRQVGLFLSVMFFVFLADGMLSDFVPGFMQSYLGSPLIMGIVMSSSSVAGLVLDLLFAKILRNTKVKPMLLFALSGCLFFVALLFLATWWPSVMLFVMAMVSWGLYYEFFGFSSQKFVVSIAEVKHRTAVWSVLETMRALAYAIAPIILGIVMARGERFSLLTISVILTLGLLVFLATKIRYAQEIEVETRHLTIWHEIEHWSSLLKHIWPAVLMGVSIALIDAIYWTTGTVVNDMLSEISPFGGLFITLYMASSLFVGIIFGRREIQKGKKRLALIFMMISGLVLSQIQAIDYFVWYLFIVFVSSLLSALAWPLLDAVYTDLLDRMGRKHVHMVGLKNASNSLAYIIGPIAGGYLAQTVGELESFAVLGWYLFVVAVFLLVVTPKKLNLPQKEIATWE